MSDGATGAYPDLLKLISFRLSSADKPKFNLSHDVYQLYQEDYSKVSNDRAIYVLQSLLITATLPGYPTTLLSANSSFPVIIPRDLDRNATATHPQYYLKAELGECENQLSVYGAPDTRLFCSYSPPRALPSLCVG